ncbi:hypothetical protein ABK040_014373 [Willaertia magna]
MSNWWGAGANISGATNVAAEKRKRNTRVSSNNLPTNNNISDAIESDKYNSIEELSSAIQQFASYIHNLDRNVKHLIRCNSNEDEIKKQTSSLQSITSAKDTDRLRIKIKNLKEKIHKQKEVLQKSLLKYQKKRFEGSTNNSLDLSGDNDNDNTPSSNTIVDSFGSTSIKVQFNKLSTQFKELCKQYEKSIKDYRESEKKNKRSNLMKYHEDDVESMFSTTSSKRNQSKHNKQNILLDEEEEEELEEEERVESGQQQLKQQFVLSSTDQSTLDVEKQIAIESQKELKELETNYYELHQCFVDLNQMVKEQDESIEIIHDNLEV